MTTKVTVDAHASWNISVTPIVGMKREYPIIVKVGEVRDFYVWEGRKLEIEEIKK